MNQPIRKGAVRRHPGPTVEWELGPDDFEKALSLLHRHRIAVHNGNDADAAATREALLRMGAPRIEGGANIALSLKLPVRIHIVRNLPKEA